MWSWIRKKRERKVKKALADADYIKAMLLMRMHEKYPNYPIRFEDVPDEHTAIGFGVFCVPIHQFKSVRYFIYNLVDELGHDGIEVLPLLRTAQSTERFYPEMLLRTKTIMKVGGNEVQKNPIVVEAFRWTGEHGQIEGY